MKQLDNIIKGTSFMEYYVNTLIDKFNYYRIHTKDCNKLPDSKNRIYLGDFSNCSEAIEEAKRIHYKRESGCDLCCKRCYKN